MYICTYVYCVYIDIEPLFTCMINSCIKYTTDICFQLLLNGAVGGHGEPAPRLAREDIKPALESVSTQHTDFTSSVKQTATAHQQRLDPATSISTVKVCDSAM